MDVMYMCVDVYVYNMYIIWNMIFIYIFIYIYVHNIYGLTDRLPGWLTDQLTDWLAGWLTDWLTDLYNVCI